MKKTNNKGFSLVELIIVIAIMAILIGVLAPQYIKYVERSRISSDKDMVDSLTKAAQTATTDDDYYDGLSTGSNIKISSGGVAVNGASMQAAVKEFYGSLGASHKFKSKAFKNDTVSIEISSVTGSSALKVSVGVTGGHSGTYNPDNYK